MLVLFGYRIASKSAKSTYHVIYTKQIYIFHDNHLFFLNQEQVFEGGDTSKFKEHTIRQRLALDTITRLMNSNPQSIDLEINKNLNEWIIEEWTHDLDVKPTIYDLSSIGNFMAYAKEFYTETTVNSLKIPLC